MTCKSCTSENPLKFGAEMIIHFPGREGLDMPTVWVFPKLLICMDCGFTEFVVPETELALLAGGMRKSETQDRSKVLGNVTLLDPRLRSNRWTSDLDGSDS